MSVAVSNAELVVIVQAWGPINDPAGGGWGWYPVARIEDPESTDAQRLRVEVLEIFGRMEQEHHATGRGPWPAARASNVARLEFRSNGQVTARATLTDLW